MATVYSDKFNVESECDIVLISSDKIHFKVPMLNLRANSEIFNDMISACGETKGARMELTESAAVLEGVLPYVLNQRLEPFELNMLDQSAQTMIAFHKYQINRGLDAVRDSFMKEFSNLQKNGLICLEAFCFAELIQDQALSNVAFLQVGDLTSKDIELAETMETCNLEARNEYIITCLKLHMYASTIYANIQLDICTCKNRKVSVDAWRHFVQITSPIAAKNARAMFSDELRIGCTAGGTIYRCDIYFNRACDEFIRRLSEM